MENQNPEDRLACPYTKMELQASPLEEPRPFTVNPTSLATFNQFRRGGTR